MPVFRKAIRAELDIIMEWAGSEGWNPGMDDASAFWAADPDGFWIAEEDGEIAACLSLVRYSADYGFLGFYIVRPEFRGKGIGRALWDRVLGENPNLVIGLDGVVAQKENYEKSGFQAAHRNIRYGGTVSVSAANADGLSEVSPVHMPLIAAYDEAFNPAPRERFLREWLKEKETRHSFVLLEGAVVSGYGTIRACAEGFKIGPLFADSETMADVLFRKLVSAAGGGRIFLDIPEPNAAARALCERYNMTPVFETARMYRGDAPELPLGQIYGITTFELG